VVLALLEQDVDYSESLRNPELYQEGPRCIYLNSTTFMLWLMNAFYDSLVVFFFTWGCRTILDNGMSTNLEITGILMYGIMLIVVTVRLAIQTQYFCWITWVCLIGSVAIYYLYLFFECAFVAGIFTTLYWAVYNLLGTSWFYLVTALVCMAALLPAGTYKTWQFLFVPTSSHEAQQMFRKAQQRKKQDALQRKEKRLQESPSAREERVNRRKTLTNAIFSSPRGSRGNSVDYSISYHVSPTSSYGSPSDDEDWVLDPDKEGSAITFNETPTPSPRQVNRLNLNQDVQLLSCDQVANGAAEGPLALSDTQLLETKEQKGADSTLDYQLSPSSSPRSYEPGPSAMSGPNEWSHDRNVGAGRAGAQAPFSASFAGGIVKL